MKIIKSSLIILITILGIYTFWACSKAGVDISTQKVQLIAPDDSMVTTHNSLSFAWNPVDYADSYTLQVFALSHGKREQMLVNADTSSTFYSYTFSNPGSYEWTVYGVNSASTTTAQFRHFTIDTIHDLSQLTVGILSPIDKYYSNKDSLLVKWSSLYGATKYEIHLFAEDSTGEEVMSAITSSANSCYIPGSGKKLTENTYWWSISAANNDLSATKRNWRSFIIDKTAPTKPDLAIKATDTTITTTNQTYLIRWKRTSTETIAYDSLFFKNSNNQTLTAARITGDSTKYQLSIPSLSAKYKVYVLSTDKAGNSSAKDSVSITFQ